MVGRRSLAAVLIVAALVGLGLLLVSRERKYFRGQRASAPPEVLVPIVGGKPPIEFTSQTQVRLNAVQSYKGVSVGLSDKIKVDAQGNLYNLRSSNHTIAVYDGDMRLKNLIGRAGKGPGELRDPHDFAISPSGVVYVADSANKRVQIFDSTGQFIGGFPVECFPEAITVNSQEEIFINGSRYKEQIIDVYSPDGKLLRSFGEPRRIDFKSLTDEDLPEDYMKRLTGVLSQAILDVDQNDNVYIAFNSAPILRKYDRFGKLLFDIETRNAMLDTMLPKIIKGLKEKIKRRSTGYKGVIIALSVDRQTGNVWVKTVAHGIFVYNSKGKKLAEVEMTDAEGKLSPAHDLDLEENRIITLDPFSKGVHIFEKPVLEQAR